MSSLYVGRRPAGDDIAADLQVMILPLAARRPVTDPPVVILSLAARRPVSRPAGDDIARPPGAR